MHEAVTASLEHLRPWMPWIAAEPLTVSDREELIGTWRQQWAEGGDVVLGVFLGRHIVGGTGLHRRLGPDGLEIGYWVHADHVGQGYATEAARALTAAALALPGIERVEIHHDKANVISGRVPRRLGYDFVGEEVRAPVASAETGIHWVWRKARPGHTFWK
jgi:ribosomal-protein-serine acetyltransferase